MSYQVLARKWRPNNFSELVGQEHVVTAISNGLANNRVHHAYLFTGTRGVGKTTIARILSKSLNCEVQVGANPCGRCPTCLDIEQGRYVDLLEIDAASRTKVEDTRELLDNVQYKPTRGRYKVYLIDEVHMLSKHSFNALLKTLEEPPEHVKFLLATTDPQKLPITILSRCLQFNLKALSREQIKHQITHILSAEKIVFQEEAINHLTHAAQGSMRDALSLTDQAIASGNGEVLVDVVIAMLGLLDRGQLSKLLASVLSQDSAKTFEWVDSLANQSPDYSQLMSELLSLLHQVALTQFVPDACKLETSTPKVIYQLARTTSPEYVQLCYQIALQGRRDLPYAADGRSGLEMTLLRMLAFRPVAQKKSPEVVNQLANEENQSQSHVVLENVNEEADVSVDTENLLKGIVDDVDTFESETNSLEHKQLIEQQAQIVEQAESFMTSSLPQEPEGIIENSELQVLESHELPTQFDSTDALEVNSEDGNISQESTLSDTASLIAMKQKIKELNETELEKASNDEDTKTRDFESLSFAPKQEKSDIEPKADSRPPQRLEVPISDQVPASESESEFKSGDDSPPFDIDSAEPIDILEIEPCFQASVENEFPVSFEEVDNDQPLIEHDAQDPKDTFPSEMEQVDPAIDFNVEDDVEVTIDIKAFNEQGEKITGSKQVDQWSDVIEKMEVRGLTKQLALHSNYSKTDREVTLLIAEGKSHLNTDIAKAQIKSSLEYVLGTQVDLSITFGVPVNTPFAIQRKINKVRQQYAYQLVERDENIQAFKQQFDATVEMNSTHAR